jgi:ATPase subunit of ABC transporter with duplicated ATPase domains
LGTLSGGQRRRVELARILFGHADVLLLDEPTNHLDADSIRWLRDFLRGYAGGFIVISHDTELLADTVNKVWHLDAMRQEIDQYAMGWSAYLLARETDERRRKRERRNAEQQAASLRTQAEKMRAKATKAKAAQGMLKRAEKLVGGNRRRASQGQGCSLALSRSEALRQGSVDGPGAIAQLRQS